MTWSLLEMQKDQSFCKEDDQPKLPKPKGNGVQNLGHWNSNWNLFQKGLIVFIIYNYHFLPLPSYMCICVHVFVFVSLLICFFLLITIICCRKGHRSLNFALWSWVSERQLLILQKVRMYPKFVQKSEKMRRKSRCGKVVALITAVSCGSDHALPAFSQTSAAVWRWKLLTQFCVIQPALGEKAKIRLKEINVCQNKDIKLSAKRVLPMASAKRCWGHTSYLSFFYTGKIFGE